MKNGCKRNKLTCVSSAQDRGYSLDGVLGAAAVRSDAYQQCHKLLAWLLDSIDVARLFGSTRLTALGWE
jgi:hypothetical protein